MIESKLKPTIATVDSCFDPVRSHQYGIASYEVFSWSTDIHILTKMVMTSFETQIQILANWPMSHAKRVTRDNWKNPEYHVIAAFSFAVLLVLHHHVFSLSLFTVLRHVSLGRPLVPLPSGAHVCAILGFLSDCILKT